MTLDVEWECIPWQGWVLPTGLLVHAKQDSWFILNQSTYVNQKRIAL